MGAWKAIPGCWAAGTGINIRFHRLGQWDVTWVEALWVHRGEFSKV